MRLFRNFPAIFMRNAYAHRAIDAFRSWGLTDYWMADGEGDITYFFFTTDHAHDLAVRCLVQNDIDFEGSGCYPISFTAWKE